MKAMVLRTIGSLKDRPRPLTIEDVALPIPKADEVRLRVHACGVCHTELDEIEGRAAPSALPRILGHQVVGVIEHFGSGVRNRRIGQRVGVAWIFRACGVCEFCVSGRENLCDRFEATGRDADGGYAEFMVAPADFVHDIPDTFSDAEAAPLLCAGAIGYRSLSLTDLQNGEPLGLMGFGASAHLVIAMAKQLFRDSAVYVFSRNETERTFARELGAVWTGAIDDPAPTALAAIIDTTPAWHPVVSALANLKPAGRLVVNAIRKEADDKTALLDLDYDAHLWREKSIQSVANVTREDVRRCLELMAAMPSRPTVTVFPLDAANDALVDLKRGAGRGARVLSVTSSATRSDSPSDPRFP